MLLLYNQIKLYLLIVRLLTTTPSPMIIVLGFLIHNCDTKLI